MVGTKFLMVSDLEVDIIPLGNNIALHSKGCRTFVPFSPVLSLLGVYPKEIKQPKQKLLTSRSIAAVKK